jgi:lipopolysaccharide-induced tumor necrosis factor-alpha factor
MASPTPISQFSIIDPAPPQYANSPIPNEKQEYQQTQPQQFTPQAQTQYTQAQLQTQYAQPQGGVAQTYYQQAPAQQQYVQPQMQQQPAQPQVQYVQVPVKHIAVAATSAFAAATPLASLQEFPAPVDCPLCKVRQMTRTEYLSGNKTHIWALVFCFFLGLPCIPYLINGFKDVQHKCGNCGGLLATWQRNGLTVVHAFPMVAAT